MIALYSYNRCLEVGQMMLFINDIVIVQIKIAVLSRCEYDPDSHSIQVDYRTAYDYTPYNILKVCHEVGHAIQHLRWPILFALRKWWIIGYWVTLFLEYDASRRAIEFIKANRIIENEIELLKVKTEMWKGLKTYL